ncbi:MAG: serine hydrolase domain-containing protein [Gammaproteobacteria bacterium]
MANRFFYPARLASRLVALCLAFVACASARAADPLPGLEKFVDGIVSPEMEKRGIAGVQLAIVKDGEVLLLKGYGLDSLAPTHSVDPARSLFRVGSISKTFEWMAVMQLVEQGALRLESPVNDFLPDDLKLPDEGFSRPVRIIDLMNHAAGFEEWLASPYVFRDADLYPLDEYLRRYRPHRVREPGRYVAYSNYGAALAGAIVAHVSGLDFETYAEKRLLQPLGLEHTTFRRAYGPQAPAGLPAPMSSDLASLLSNGLEWAHGRWLSSPQEHLLRVPSGGMVSTASDMSRWMMALLEPKLLEQAGVLASATFSLMKTDSFPQARVAGLRHGFLREEIGYENLSHTGRAIHFLSSLVVIPELGLGVFISTNSATGGTLISGLDKQLLAQYFPRSPTSPVPHSAPASKMQTTDVSGWYLPLLRSYTNIEKILSIPAIVHVDVDARGDVLTRSYGRTQRFVRTGADELAELETGTTIAFSRADDGVYMRGFLSTAERISLLETPRWLFAALAAGAIASCAMLVAAFGRRAQAIAESKWERRSATWLNAACAAWLTSFFVLGVWEAGRRSQSDEIRFMLEFPQLSLKLASAGFTLAAAITMAALATLPCVWAYSNWSRWRRVGHTACVVLLLALVGTLNTWNLVGMRWN